MDPNLWDKADGEPDDVGSGKEACVWLRTDKDKLYDYGCSAGAEYAYGLCELQTYPHTTLLLHDSHNI